MMMMIIGVMKVEWGNWCTIFKKKKASKQTK